MRHSLYVDLVSTLTRFSPNIARAGVQLDALGRKVGDGSTKVSRDFDKIGKASMVAGGVMLAGVGLAVKAAVQWESAWAGVLKTATADQNTLAGRMQLQQLEDDLRGLARTLPTTHAEIAAVAEAAGQLGVATPDVARFTKTMIDLGTSTNLSAEDAATGLARMMNVMQTAPEDVDRMGATLVALGNAGASTEADIVAMSQRIAGAAATVGASEADVMALANALSSMGVQSELGSGVMTRTLLELETAASAGAAGLQDYAKVAGVSAQEFAEAWERDPVRALSMFTDGVGRLQESGGNAVKALEDIGAQGTLDKQVLLALAGSGDLLTRSLDLGAESWRENTALVEEANKRYETTESRLKIARNSLSDFAIDLGGVLLPALAQVADGVRDLGEWLRGLPDPVKEALAVLGTVGGVVALVGGAALVAIPKIAALRASLVSLGIVSETSAGKVGVLGNALKVLGAAGIIAAIAGGLDVVWNVLADGGPKVDAMTEALLRFGENGKVTGALAQSFGADLSNLGDVIERGTKNAWAEEVKGWFDPRQWFGGESGAIAVKDAANQLDSLDKALEGLVAGGHADKAAVLYSKVADAAREQGVSTGELEEATDAYHDALEAQTAQAELAAEVAYEQAGAVDAVSGSLETGYESLGSYARALGQTEEETEALVKQVRAWGEALGEFIDPAGTYNGMVEAMATKTAESTEDASDSWEDYAADVQVSFDQYIAELEAQVKAQETWAANMTLLAGQVSEGTLDYLAQLGPEGARLVADLSTKTEPELQAFDDLVQRKTAAAISGQAEKWRLWNDLAPKLTAKIGRDAVAGLAAELAAGTTTVAQIAQTYGMSLAGGVNPLLAAVGKKGVVYRNGAMHSGGGGVPEFAEGGHVRGLGSGTSDSIDAKLSNGEYVVRADAVSAYGVELLDDMNQLRLANGGLVVRKYAAGGFVSDAAVPKPPAPGRSGVPVSTAAAATMDLAYQTAMQAVRDLQTVSSGGPGGPTGFASTTGLNPQFLSMFRSYNAALGNILRITSGWRSSAAQARLYREKPHLAAPPGKSNHERGLAIDHAPHSTPAMRAVAARFGLVYPMLGGGKSRKNEPWHVEPRGRATGGLVGKTPMARAVPKAAPRAATARVQTLSERVALMRDLPAVRALVDAWESLNDAMEKAQRRRELVADHSEAAREYNAAKAVTARVRAELARTATTKAQISARDQLAAAERRLRQADTPKERENANAALAIARRKVATSTTEAQAAAQRKLSDALSDEQRVRERYSEAIKGVREFDAAAARDREAAAVQRVIDKLEREAEVREALVQRRDDAQRDLNSMLDDVADVRRREVEATEQYNEDVLELTERRASAERDLAESIAAAQTDLARSQEQLLATRAGQLESWAALDERHVVGWGNTVGQLIDNARQQAQQFDEWQDALADARGRGVSEGVIEALGLADSPKALAQLRMFGRATTAEIEALNAEVGTRRLTAEQQAAAEAQAGLGQLGRDLLAAQDVYATALMDLQERFAEESQAIDRELAQAQATLKREQAQLAQELAQIGMTQGRSYADALAQGLNSGIPGVVAAAQALQAAAQAAQRAGGGMPGGVTGSVPTASLAPRAQMIGGVYTDLTTGRAAWYGPNGEPGGAQRTSTLTASYTMPDGRIAWYQPGNMMYADPSRNRTYDAGGILPPGRTIADNKTRQDEYVLTRQQLGAVAMSALPAGAAGGGGGTTDVRVFIGDRELTDLVRVTVDGTLTERRTTAAIAGRR